MKETQKTAFNPIQKEQDYYKAHKAEFVEKYLGKEVLIYQGALQGVFENSTEALKYAIDHNYEDGKIMIHTVREKEPKMHIFVIASVASSLRAQAKQSIPYVTACTY